MSNVRQISFASGEISPSVQARVDMIRYTTGLHTCRNFIVMRHGGITNRTGTTFVGRTKHITSPATTKTRLIPFVFNNEQSYALEFGNYYMRVIRSGNYVREPAKVITGAAAAAGVCTITSAAHGYANDNEVFISGVQGMISLNGEYFKIGNVTANTFELAGTNAAGFAAYTGGGAVERIYEIATPFDEAYLYEFSFTQSGDVLTLVNPRYAITEIIRAGEASWSWSYAVLAPIIAAPTNLTASSGGAGGWFVVTAVDAETGEESLPSVPVQTTTGGVTLYWTAVSSAGYYNIYKSRDYEYGWVGLAGASATPSFVYTTAYTTDVSSPPPKPRPLFDSASNYPSTVALYQQRRIFANTDTNVEGVWTSRTALPRNFLKAVPLTANGPITFSISGKQVNEVRHLLDIGSKLVVFTEGGEWSLEGDSNGVITPSAINAKQYSAYGANSLAPIRVGQSALFVQSLGSAIRDLVFSFSTQGYEGNDRSVFAAHLFDGYTIADWTYQQTPHSIIWCVRNDGILLALTYIKEHEIFGWHRHDTNGVVKSVCCIPEGKTHVVYMTVERTVYDAYSAANVQKTYVERLDISKKTDIRDMIYMDSASSYDGRNTTATTMTLSGGTAWTYTETLTLTAGTAFFSASDVGNEIWITGADGKDVRCRITAYSSSTVVSATPHKTVPVDLRNTATAAWSRAVDNISGLFHLDGKGVSVVGDGNVVANPNNAAYVPIAVSGGAITLSSPQAVVHVGLPYVSDMKTLQIDSLQTQSLADKKKHVSQAAIHVESSRGVFAGLDEDHLFELKIRENETYDEPVALKTGIVVHTFQGAWTAEGRIHIRQIDPLPLSILSVVPAGFIAAG